MNHLYIFNPPAFSLSLRSITPLDEASRTLPNVLWRYGGCAWGTFGCAGFLESRSANLRTAATLDRFAAIRGSSSTLGAPPMKHLYTCDKSVSPVSAPAGHVIGEMSHD